MHARILAQSEEPKWSQFVATHPFSNIHQTPRWGHFQAKVPGRGKYWIVVIEDKMSDKSVPGHRFTPKNRLPEAITSHGPDHQHGIHSPTILAGALIVRHALPKGYCWLYAPRGPLLNYENEHEAKLQMQALVEAIKPLAKKEKALFFRADPALAIRPTSAIHPSHSPSTTHGTSAHSSSASPLHFAHFRFIDHGFQPNDTLLLDLEKSEEQLLSEMKPKGRYNIKLAEKKGVKVHIADPANADSANFAHDLSAFHKILQETTTRDGFSGHPQSYYENMLKSLQPTPHAQLYLATFENQVIAGLLATTYNGTTIYYYGASGAAHRNLMAPYLLQWQAIREAKQIHCHTYDFLGISPPQAESASAIAAACHPWAGVTDFKKKFGGQSVSFQPPQEFVFKPLLYHFYRLYKKLR